MVARWRIIFLALCRPIGRTTLLANNYRAGVRLVARALPRFQTFSKVSARRLGEIASGARGVPLIHAVSSKLNSAHTHANNPNCRNWRALGRALISALISAVIQR